MKEASESYLIHFSANNSTLTKLALFNSSEECTFEKKSRNN